MFGEAKAERASIRDYFTNVIPSDYPVAPHITHIFFNPEQSVVRKGCNQDTSHFFFNHSIGSQDGSFKFRVFGDPLKKIDILIASCKWHRLMNVVVRSHEAKGGGGGARLGVDQSKNFDVTTLPLSSDATRTV